VTEQVQGLYRQGDNGLYLRDAGPLMTASDHVTSICSREATAAVCTSADGRPRLTVRFGE
jgi:hypothetical protein